MTWPDSSRRATIGLSYRGSTIAVGVSSRTAGAIDSVIWRGTQFINTYDHGRQLQSAVSFNGYGECFNPTEAGSVADGTGPHSTSLLLALELGARRLRTRTQMAYWIETGSRAGECPKGIGPYRTSLSDVVLTKEVLLGAEGVANAIAVRVTYKTPIPRGPATFEALTAYLPPAFSTFWSLDPRSGTLQPLSDGPGEQGAPIIFSTQDGSRALGVYSPDLPQAQYPDAGYGRWRFDTLPGAGNATVKWNCVFRTLSTAEFQTFACYVLVGDLRVVRSGLKALAARLLPKGPTGAALDPEGNSAKR
ncbi:hypothetical protein [Methylobacterium hispanicum]|uniref:hypothetical protein n=1 Tax=Methylobacterium hispanicum TaxID=270350 RepID=UPI002F2F368B